MGSGLLCRKRRSRDRECHQVIHRESERLTNQDAAEKPRTLVRGNSLKNHQLVRLDKINSLPERDMTTEILEELEGLRRLSRKEILGIDDVDYDKPDLAAEDLRNLNEEAGELGKAMNRLSHRPREIIKARNEIGVNKVVTFDDLGKIFGVTRERIRQIETAAMQELNQDPIFNGNIDRPIFPDLHAMRVKLDKLKSQGFATAVVEREIAQAIARRSAELKQRAQIANAALKSRFDGLRQEI